jgi:2-oxoisovalerate dehydrogenase E2 component (dihydrolipoyl transacylase)
MAIREFLLPDLGEGLEDAEVVTWHVAEGDRVELNQPLVEVNTAKALVEIPSPWEGVVEKLYAADGDVVKVGEPLVSIRLEDGAPAEEPKPKRRAVLVGYGVEEEEEEEVLGESTRAKTREAGGPGPVPASPPVRRLAKELGVDLAAVHGSGPGGRVTREDVTAAANAQPAPTERPREGDVGERIPVKGIRRMIAEKMSRSAREIPHVTTFLTIDASSLQAFRADLEKETGRRLSPLPIVVRALAEVCRDHPKLNARFSAEDSVIELIRPIHVGIATDTPNGLLVPVVHDADGKGLLDLAEEIAQLSETARAGTARVDDMTGGTITVTNVGTFGAEFGTPIINHPEVAILALGVIEPRALVFEDRVEARPAATLSLSFDHRVLDGAEAGRALQAVKELLESPFRLGALPR